MEFGLGEQTTLELTGGYNPWTLDKEQNKKLKHWLVMPEFRYWLCERFNGHFFGIHTGYTFYNISGVRIPSRARRPPTTATRAGPPAWASPTVTRGSWANAGT